jgi:hypothetical protein
MIGLRLHRVLLGGLVLLPLLACPNHELPDHIRVFPAGTAWPQAIEGALQVMVEEGDVGPDGICDENFGSITFEGKSVLVAASGDALRAAGISREQAHQEVWVLAELQGPSALVDDTYVVSRLTRRRQSLPPR